MNDIKNRIEAILFTTGQFMDLEEIAKLCNIGSIGVVKDALNELVKEYNNRNCALQIFEENGKFKLNIRKDYVYLTNKLLNDTELDKPTQETLAVIAYKQPVLQSEIIQMRGNKAYDHIKVLKEHEFITSEKHGRTRLLKLTQKFYDYFDIATEDVVEKFKEIEEKVGSVEPALKENNDENKTIHEFYDLPDNETVTGQ